MSREWKPGDVAMVTWENGRSGALVAAGRASASGWYAIDGGGCFIPDDWVKEARPLVVLDPENAEDAGRLAEALYLAGLINVGNTDGEYRAGMADRVQAALRELANPTPPRIDEPGTWGVVEASCVHRTERVKWIRHEDGNWWPAEFYGDVKARVDKGRDPRLPDDWDSLVDPVLVRAGVTPS